MKKLFCLLLAALLAAAPGLCAPASEEGNCYTVLLLGEQGPREGEAAYGPTDAMLLASVNLISGAVRILSLDCDLLSADGTMRIGDASAPGGPLSALEAVNELYQTSVDHYIHLDVNGLGDIVRALGGVEMEILPGELALAYPDGAPVFGEPGVQSVSAEQAQVFAISAADGDAAGRSARQRRLIAALYAALVKSGMRTAVDFAMTAVAYMETNISMRDIVYVAAIAFSSDSGGVRQTSAPMTQSQRAEIDGQSAIAVSEADAEIAQVHAFLFSK